MTDLIELNAERAPDYNPMQAIEVVKKNNENNQIANVADIIDDRFTQMFTYFQKRDEERDRVFQEKIGKVQETQDDILRENKKSNNSVENIEKKFDEKDASSFVSQTKSAYKNLGNLAKTTIAIGAFLGVFGVYKYNEAMSVIQYQNKLLATKLELTTEALNKEGEVIKEQQKIIQDYVSGLPILVDKYVKDSTQTFNSKLEGFKESLYEMANLINSDAKARLEADKSAKRNYAAVESLTTEFSKKMQNNFYSLSKKVTGALEESTQQNNRNISEIRNKINNLETKYQNIESRLESNRR